MREVDALAFDGVHLVHGATRTALMRRVREDRETGAQVGAGHGAVHLALIGTHLERRCDLAECAPALRRGVADQFFDQLVL